MSKPISKGLVIVLTLVAGVFMAPSLMFFGSVQDTKTIADFSDDADANTMSDTSSSMI
jgi:hypothetical protein